MTEKLYLHLYHGQQYPYGDLSISTEPPSAPAQYDDQKSIQHEKEPTP